MAVPAPDLEGPITALMRGYVDALDALQFDVAFGMLSKCAQKETTVANLATGRTATGRLTLSGTTQIERLSDSRAQALVQTTSQFLVGSQSNFRARTRFVFEDNAWKIDSSTPGKC